MTINLDKILPWVLLVPLMLLQFLYYGWAFSILWGWFLIPLGFPVLSLPQFMGLWAVRSFIFHKHSGIETPAPMFWFLMVFTPLFFLTVGFVIRFWIM